MATVCHCSVIHWDIVALYIADFSVISVLCCTSDSSTMTQICKSTQASPQWMGVKLVSSLFWPFVFICCQCSSGEPNHFLFEGQNEKLMGQIYCVVVYGTKSLTARHIKDYKKQLKRKKNFIIKEHFCLTKINLHNYYFTYLEVEVLVGTKLTNFLVYESIHSSHSNY